MSKIPSGSSAANEIWPILNSTSDFDMFFTYLNKNICADWAVTLVV